MLATIGHNQAFKNDTDSNLNEIDERQIVKTKTNDKY